MFGIFKKRCKSIHITVDSTITVEEVNTKDANDPIEIHNNNPPKCINIGCDSPVAYRAKDERGKKMYRIHCSNCQKASYGAAKLKPGVTAFKKNLCSNQDSHLGFDCPTNFNRMPLWGKALTEVDHIDGNNTNNSTDNLQELCKYCHSFKGQRNGDFNGRKNL